MLIEALVNTSPEYHRCVEIMHEAHAIWMRKNGNMSVHDMATMKKLKAEGWALLKTLSFGEYAMLRELDIVMINTRKLHMIMVGADEE